MKLGEAAKTCSKSWFNVYLVVGGFRYDFQRSGGGTTEDKTSELKKRKIVQRRM